MASTLEEMATRGAAKLSRKSATMKANYDAAKARMKENFGKNPFGPITKAAYNAGVDAAEYRAPDTEKWKANWRAAMSR